MEAVQILADALRLAERAHAQAELAGHKGPWADFYAQWIVDNIHLWSKHSCSDGSCDLKHD